MPPTKVKPKPWSMFPSLHQEVLRYLQDTDLHFRFHNIDDPINYIQKYDTNIMGRFVCHNRACTSGGWSSKMIAISIRLYPNSTYNARIYHQRCRECKRLAKPRLDDSYAERVVYRLKKWSGFEMDLPHYSGRSSGPHQSDLCEGCKNGVCSVAIATAL